MWLGKAGGYQLIRWEEPFPITTDFHPPDLIQVDSLSHDWAAIQKWNTEKQESSKDNSMVGVRVGVCGFNEKKSIGVAKQMVASILVLDGEMQD